MFGALGVLLGDMKTKILMALTAIAALVILFFLVSNYIDRRAERDQNNANIAGKIEDQRINTEIAQGSGKINTDVVQTNAEKKQESAQNFDDLKSDFEKKIDEINKASTPKEVVKIPVVQPGKIKQPQKRIVVEEVPITPGRDPRAEEIAAANISSIWDAYCLAAAGTNEQCVK